MKRSSIFAKATPLLLGVGLALSACAATPDAGAVPYYTPYAYDGYGDYPYDPGVDWFDFGFGGSDHDHHAWDFHHEYDGHGFRRSGVRGVAANFGHGFAGHGGGHGGGGGHGRG